jgi:hypothetical protein
VLLHLADEGAVFRRVDADHLVRPAEGDELLVGRNVGRQDRVRLVTDFNDLLASLDVPDDDLARLPAAAAAGQ